MSRYGAPKRTRGDKLKAAIQFIVMSDKSDAEKLASLVSSYGLDRAAAVKLMGEVGG